MELSTTPSLRFDLLARVLVLLPVTAVLLLLVIHGQVNLLSTVTIATCLLLVSFVDKALAALLTFSYLLLMGDIRRLVSFVSEPTSFDPLLLIGPVLAFTLAFPLLMHVRLREKLSMAMMLLMIIMVLELFNPSQGGLAVGLSGALFYLAPVFWFWVGRQFASPAVLRLLLYRVLLPLSLCAALLGLAQGALGFLPWEQAWIDRAAALYPSLHLGHSIRSFGFSVSSAEYTTLLTMGACIVFANLFIGDRRWLWILLPVVPSIILASERGPLLKLIVALATLWAVRRGTRPSAAQIGQLLGVAVVVILGLSIAAGRLLPIGGPDEEQHSAIQDALSHQAGGLAHPFDKRYSTAGVHTDMVASAFWEGVTYPIGHGLGATTLAVAKFGSNAGVANSEVDITDMFVCLGLVGGLTYTFAVCAAMLQSFRYLQRVPLHVSLATMGVLICTLGSWLISGQYSTASILFFMVGGLVYEPRQGVRSLDHA